MRSVLKTAWFAAWLGFQLAGITTASAAELASPTELKQVIDQTLGGAAPAKCGPPTKREIKLHRRIITHCISLFMSRDEDESTYQDYKEEALSNLERGGLELPAGMDLNEYIALLFYTGSGYEALNRALRSGPPSSTKARPCTELINSALATLPPQRGQFVFRGADLPKEALERHTKGALIRYEAFTSTSGSVPFPGETQFVIRSERGRRIKRYSAYPNEDEVLFSAPSCFEVVERLTPETLNREPAQVPWKDVDLSKLRYGWKHLLLMQEVPCAK